MLEVQGFKAYWLCNGGRYEYYPHIDRVYLLTDWVAAAPVNMSIQDLLAVYGQPKWM